LNRPGRDDSTGELGKWNKGRDQPPLHTFDAETGAEIVQRPPYIMVGCHKTSTEVDFRDFGWPGAVYDELAFWMFKLEVNRTHDQTLYFMGGYSGEIMSLQCLNFLL